MTLKERYKFHSRKSIKPYTKLVLLIFLVITMSQTFARYSENGDSDAGIHVAKWSIAINNEQVDENTESLTQAIQLVNAENGTTKVDAGDDCYFDIIINPDETEVSISYSISVDLESQDTTLPTGTKIVKYEQYNGTSSEPASTTNVDNTSVTIENDVVLNELIEKSLPLSRYS